MTKQTLSIKQISTSKLIARRGVLGLFACSVGLAYKESHAFWFQSDLTWPDVFAMIEKEFPGTPAISTQALAALLAQDAPMVIIDVREKREFNVSHLPNAQHADTLTAVRALIASAPKGATIVLYCSVGYRSAKWVHALAKEGSSKVVNLNGSIFMWANEGRSVVQGKSKATKVHPFSKRWGALLNESLRAELP